MSPAICHQIACFHLPQKNVRTHLSAFALPFFLGSLVRDFELSPSAPGDELEFGEPKNAMQICAKT
jgi:hypothetical protein